MKKMIFVLSAILVVCVVLCGCEATEDTNIKTPTQQLMRPMVSLKISQSQRTSTIPWSDTMLFAEHIG